MGLAYGLYFRSFRVSLISTILKKFYYLVSEEDVSSQAVRQFPKFAFYISINLVGEQQGKMNSDNSLVMAQCICMDSHCPASKYHGVMWSGPPRCCTHRSVL